MATKRKMPEENYIYSYYQQICNGGVTVGKWIRLLYEYLVQGIEESKFFFDQKKANDAVTWIEAHCFHTEGPKAPGPLILELWQKALISSIFGLVDKDGNRQFREVMLVVARKNGKSLLAAAIANYVFRLEGGYGSRVYCVAPKLDQADIVYNNIWTMIQLDPEWQELKALSLEKDTQHRKVNDDSMLARHRQTDLFIPGTNSTVKKLAFSVKSSDGFNPQCCIMDEIAAWSGTNGLRQYEVMKSGMGARPEGLLLSCTTSGYVNDSIYDEMIKRSTRFLLGDSKEKRLLPFLYMIDDVEKWNDINELRKSNPNLDKSVTVGYMLEEIAVAEGSLSRRSEFICKMANIKQNASTAWLPSEVVERACGEPLKMEDFRDHYACAGLDLSQTRDLTSACVVIEKKGELYVFSRCWLPAAKIEEATARDGVPYDIYIKRGLLFPSGENFVDYNDCYNWFVELIEEHQIYSLRVGYDRWSADYLIQQLKAFGYVCDDVWQGDNLFGVLQEAHGLLEDGKIHIGDNDLLKMHLLNGAIKMSVERGRGKLVKLSPNAHIDAAAALIDALTVRQKWYAEIGEQLRNEEN